MLRKTKGIIFDLDNCIFDTKSLGSNILVPVLEPLYVAAQEGTVAIDEVDHISQKLWTMGLEDLVQEFNITPHIAEAMRSAYAELNVLPSARTYGDEDYILELPGRKLLVTTGYRRFQQSKIDKLHIAHLFQEIIIDAYEDRPRKGKKQIFKEILLQHRWLPAEVAVVGDNPASELGAAKDLGMLAIQTVRPGIEEWAEANMRICSFSELIEQT